MRIALAKLHASVFLAGFTGTLGKVITLPETPLVWWRLLLAIVMLYVFLRLRGAFRPPSPRSLATLYLLGGSMAFGWIFFYGSIKAATVAVALVCVSLTGFFTALFSPPILKTPWSPREFLYSAFSIAGIALIFHFDAQYRFGILLGCAAAAIRAVYIICNKKFASSHPDQNLVFFHEMCGGFLLASLCLGYFMSADPSLRFAPSALDLAYLLLLAGFCTVVMYVLQLQALQNISPFTVNLTFNLEPIYSIILATLLLGEGKTFTSSFHAGLALIVLSVVLQSLHVVKNQPSPPPPDETTRRKTRELGIPLTAVSYRRLRFSGFWRMPLMIFP